MCLSRIPLESLPEWTHIENTELCQHAYRGRGKQEKPKCKKTKILFLQRCHLKDRERISTARLRACQLTALTACKRKFAARFTLQLYKHGQKRHLGSLRKLLLELVQLVLQLPLLLVCQRVVLGLQLLLHVFVAQSHVLLHIDLVAGAIVDLLQLLVACVL